MGDGFVLRRVLPSAQRRLVGPFIFVDHFGPVTLSPGQGFDVRPHPHICLATLTWLWEGEFVHRDSLGSLQTIAPGDLNWMVAGRGIVHSERVSAEVRARGQTMHGLQVWVALPDGAEEVEPSFAHHAGATLPRIERDGAHMIVIAGDAYGARSPVGVYSRTLYVDVRLDADRDLELPADHVERAVYVIDGHVESDGQRFGVGSMLVFRPGDRASVRAHGPAHVVLFGGDPIGHRYVEWNFVASTKERIAEARQAWKDQAFPKVPGDDQEFIPLPG